MIPVGYIFLFVGIVVLIARE
ncbi:DUF3955 domain-containing protein [Lactobacillus gallinarum]|nr:DUF3955 domain-containing protein [Lactobacillus gallinarum]